MHTIHEPPEGVIVPQMSGLYNQPTPLWGYDDLGFDQSM